MATELPPTPASGTRSLGRAAESLPSPARLSRLQEKEELQQLNDRLAVYIERVQALEADNSALQQRLAEQETGSDRELGCLRLHYEAELADARRALDDIAIERATLQVELGKIGEEHRQLHIRNSKKETDLNVAQARMRDLDAQLNAKEAHLATALNENRTLENELRELKDEVLTLNLSLEDTTKHLHSEMLRRVDLENNMKTLQEEMTFQKRLHEDELKETRRIHESRVAEVESGRQREFESKLSAALQELRKQHEEQIQGYKEELERTFSAKVENAQLTARKNSESASAAQEELVETRKRLDTLLSQVNKYQSQNVALESKIKELQDLLDYDRDLHRRRMAEKEEEMAQARRQAQEQLEEYEHLLDVKLALDLEISAYRKMLEGEEQRLKLSPSLSSRSMATPTTSQGRRFLLGKKRKMKESRKRERSAVFQTIHHASASGSVSIEEIDADGKFVRLKNNSNVIWGAAAGVSPGPSDLVWKSQRSWGTGGSIGVTLITDDGEELAERKITFVPREEESSEQDDDYEEITGSDTEFPSQEVEIPLFQYSKFLDKVYYGIAVPTLTWTNVSCKCEKASHSSRAGNAVSTGL
ncbi:Lamin-L [Willisornis vidua]|uniref:Lamin-L n=1 Tax=Willisornis vidua TaxID=1566151 RepID=A0ABQ9CUB6_9PASS|nr:Lamin-L [Willisornis vidua]